MARLTRCSLAFALLATMASASSLATGTTPGAAPGPNTVTMSFDTKSGFSFAPKELTVPVGTTVNFANTDGSNHSVVFKDGTASGRMKHHTSWTRTFSAPGTYPYECSLHGASMSGTIIVK